MTINSIGPRYCKKCGNTAFHYYITDRPFAGVDLILSMIVTHKVQCCCCDRQSRVTLNDRKIAHKLKKAGFFEDLTVDEFTKFILNALEENNAFDDDVKNLDLDEIAKKVEEQYARFNMSHEWFFAYVELIYIGRSKQIKHNKTIYNN